MNAILDNLGTDTMQDRLAKVQSAKDELRQSLEAVRRSILKTQDEIDHTRTLDASPEEALVRIATWAQLGYSQAKARLPSVARFANGRYLSGFSAPSAPDPRDLLLVYGWPIIFENLKKAVAKHYGESEGITAEARRSTLERLESDLLDLELVEESMIRSAERAGIPIPRRSNADPRAVLATDASLP